MKIRLRPPITLFRFHCQSGEKAPGYVAGRGGSSLERCTNPSSGSGRGNFASRSDSQSRSRETMAMAVFVYGWFCCRSPEHRIRRRRPRPPAAAFLLPARPPSCTTWGCSPDCVTRAFSRSASAHMIGLVATTTGSTAHIPGSGPSRAIRCWRKWTARGSCSESGSRTPQTEQPGLLDRKQEHIKIYIDGRDRPALDVPLERILRVLIPISLDRSFRGVWGFRLVRADPVPERLQDRGARTGSPVLPDRPDQVAAGREVASFTEQPEPEDTGRAGAGGRALVAVLASTSQEN